MADQTVTLRIAADAKGLITGVELAKKETRTLGDEGERAGRKLGGGMAVARAELEKNGLLVNQLKGFVLGLGTAVASIQTVKALAGMADTWSDLTARVGLSIREHESASDVMARLADISRQTYSSMELTAESYTRNATTLNALNKSTAQQLDYAQALNNALVVSGAKGQQAEMVQNSLAKAMAEGTLRGEEMNNVLSYGSRIAELLAEELGVNVTQLRALSAEGEITGEVIFNSLVKNMQALTEEAESMPATIEDAFVLLRNSVLQAVGVFDQQNAVSESMAEWLIVVADNMNTVINVSVSLATLYGARMVPVLAASAAGWLANTSQVIAYNASLLRLAGTSPAVVASLGAISRALALASAAVPALLALGAAYATVTGLMSAVDRAIERNEATWRGHTSKLREASLALDDINTRLDDVAATQPLPTEIIEQYTQAVIALNEAEQQRQILAQQAANAQARIAASQAGWFDSLGTFLTKITGATIGAEDALESVSQQQREMGGLTDDLTEKLDRAAVAFDRTFGASVQAGIRVVKEELANMVPATDLAGAISNWWSAFQTGASAASARLDEMNQATQNLDNMKARIIAAGTTATRQLEELGAKGSANLKRLASEALEFARANGMSEEQLAALKATFDSSIASVTAYEAAQKKTRQTTDAAAQAAAEYVRSLEKEIAIFGLSEAAVREYELAHTKGLTPAQRAQAKAALDQIAANQKLKAVWDTAAQAALTLARGNADLRERIAQHKDALAGLTPAQIAYNAGVREQAVLEAQLALGKEGLSDAMRAELAARLDLLKSYADGEKALDAQAESARKLESILSRFDDIGFSGLIRDMDRVKAALDEATDPAQIARLQNALGHLRQEALVYATDALGQGISSLQSMASEGSKAYKALEVAQTALNLATAIGAIANQGMGDPYTAFARIAAMAAMMAQLVDGIGSLTGGSGGPSANSAAYRQEHQGTGTVLGDAAAKSESIARAVEITASATQQLVGINRSMLNAMNAMAAGLAGASGMLARGAADTGPVSLSSGASIPSIGGNSSHSLFVRSFANIFGGKESLRDQGIRIVGGYLSSMIDDIVVQSYASIHRSGGWFRSSRDYDRFESLDDGVAAQFGLVLGSMADTVRAAADALGMNMDAINAAIAAFEIEEIRISTMDLSAEEAQAELAAVFSAIFDDLAGHVVPFVAQFQRVGEGLGETLVRVATSVQVTQEAVRQLGISLDEADPERLAQISVGLVDLMGGVEEFIAGMTGFVSAFAPENHKFSVAQDALTRAFAQFGLEIPTSRDAMWELMQSLDATTASGREQIAMLLQLADVSDSYYTMLEDHASRMAAIDASIADGAWGQYLDGLTDSQRAVAELTKHYDDWRESLIAAGATSEQLAAVEDQRAVALERLLAAAEAEYQSQVGNVRDMVDARGMSEFALEMRDIDRWAQQTTDALNAAAVAAGRQYAAEEDLALVHAETAARAAEAIAKLRASAAALVAELFGPAAGSLDDINARIAEIEARSAGSFGAVESGIGNAVDAWIAGIARVQDFLDSILLSAELSTLTPEQMLAEAQGQFDTLLAAARGGDADALSALPDAARTLLELGRDFWSSGDQYQQLFDTTRDALQTVAGMAGPAATGGAPGYTSSGHAGVSGELAELYAQRDALLAEQEAAQRAEMIESLGGMIRELIQATGEPLAEVAASIGLNLTELAESLGIDLNDVSVATATGLVDMARLLGVDVAELAQNVGISLGSLADDQSLLNQALQGEIDKLPEGQRDALQELFDNIVTATTEADANAAIGTMADYINTLDADIRNQLAPYFADLDPTPVVTELTRLSDLAATAGLQLDAAREANQFLRRIAENNYAANEAAGLPAYAAGGWVNGPTALLAGEAGRELILPNPVSEFFARHGIPVNSGGGEALAAEVRMLREEVRMLRAESRQGDAEIAQAARGAGDKVAGKIDSQTEADDRRSRELIAATERSNR